MDVCTNCGEMTDRGPFCSDGCKAEWRNKTLRDADPGYTAILMSGNFERGRFPTEKAAWDFVETQLCRGCKDDLAAGLDSHPANTMCGAEWDVVLTKDLIALEKKA